MSDGRRVKRKIAGYLEAVEYAQILAVHLELACPAGCRYLRSVHSTHQTDGGADGLVGVQQRESSFTLGLSHQQLPTQSIGLRSDCQCLRARLQLPEQHALLVQAEPGIAGFVRCWQLDKIILY